MTLRVTHYGEPVLQEKGQAVTRFDEDLRRLANDMFATMVEAEGIGLAAQQVGLALQFCVVDVNLPETEKKFFYQLDGRTPPLDLIMPLALANPIVQPEPEPIVPYEEGCLSFPGIRASILRPDRIRVRYQDLDGRDHILLCDGLLARVIQHEVDHLQGILFTERMAPETFALVEARVKRLRRETRAALRARQG